MRRFSAIAIVLVFFLTLSSVPALARTKEDLALWLAYGMAEKVTDTSDPDKSRAHVNDLRTALEDALATMLQSDHVFARGDTGSPTASDAYRLIGILAVMEGRPNEAAAAFAKGEALPGIDAERKRQFVRARASALALDGQFQAARALCLAVGCGEDRSCPDDRRGLEGGLLTGTIDIPIFAGPVGVCNARLIRTSAEVAEIQSLHYLVEPYYRLAIESARATPLGTPGRGFALALSTHDLADWLARRGRGADAVALVSDMETDEDYLAARKAYLGTPLDYRYAKEFSGSDLTSAHGDPTKSAERTKEKIDAGIALAWTKLRKLDDGHSVSEKILAADASRELSSLYRERGDLQLALELNDHALLKIAEAVPPYMPLKADLGPRAPDCTPYAALVLREAACLAWYSEIIDRYASLDLASLLAERSSLEAEAGRIDDALHIDALAATVQANWLRSNWSESDAIFETLTMYARVNVDRLATLAIARSQPNLESEAQRQAFDVAQLLQIGSVDAAVRKAAIRRQLGPEDNQALLQQWQRLLDEQRLAGDPVRREALARSMASLEAKLPIAISALERRSSFAPLPLADARRMLRQDEALLVILPLADRTEVFAINDRTVRWATAAVSADWIAVRVAKLRAHLDPENASAPAFDRKTAFELHAALLAPIDEVIEGRTIFASISGSLKSLPLGVLVREPPTGRDDDPAALRTTRWLGLSHPVVMLPSVNALALLKARPPTRPRTTMIGFGAVPPRGGAQVEVVRSRPGDLPFAREELENLARAYGGKAILGPDATEARLRSSDLSGVGILAFATHGITGGQDNEPGLILAIGEGGSEDDGFLTFREAASLSIDADIVVLSACNTASGDGKGGEALSGLAQAFLFAGSRTVLATHWPVVDKAAAALVVNTLASGERDAVAVAKSLRAAVVRFISDSEGTMQSDPLWWGAYVVVGG